MADPCLRCQLPDCDEDSPECGYVQMQKARLPRIVRSIVNAREAELSKAYRAIKLASTTETQVSANG